ncbi:MAG: hypothetical protein QOG54_1346 [Actinomycetota bacterium]|nr:hypothetical protein [Actinomycetota bacterium]
MRELYFRAVANGKALMNDIFEKHTFVLEMRAQQQGKQWTVDLAMPTTRSVRYERIRDGSFPCFFRAFGLEQTPFLQLEMDPNSLFKGKGKVA